MTTQTLTLSAFLLARIEDDESVARRSMAQRYGDQEAPHLLACGLNSYNTDTCDCGYPARVLAECAAKRAIVEVHHEYLAVCSHCVELGGAYDREAWPCSTLRALASVHADHPDFDPSWSL